jgi:hypothetical protein
METSEQAPGGCSCEGRSQVPAEDSLRAGINTGLMGASMAIGAAAIARYKPIKLLLFVPGVIALATWWRKFVCARCVYYGRTCSTLLGVWTSKILPRDEERELDRDAMIVDLAFIGLLAAMPLPQVMRNRKLAALYFAALALGSGRVLFLSCPTCANEFCPMKDLHGMVTGS